MITQGHLMFETRSENCNFLKYKLKDTCFSVLKSYWFDKVDKYLSETESRALKSLIEH